MQQASLLPTGTTQGTAKELGRPRNTDTPFNDDITPSTATHLVPMQQASLPTTSTTQGTVKKRGRPRKRDPTPPDDDITPSTAKKKKYTQKEIAERNTEWERRYQNLLLLARRGDVDSMLILPRIKEYELRMVKSSTPLQMKIELLDIYHYLVRRQDQLNQRVTYRNFGSFVGLDLPNQTLSNWLQHEERYRAKAMKLPKNACYIIETKQKQPRVESELAGSSLHQEDAEEQQEEDEQEEDQEEEETFEYSPYNNNGGHDERCSSPLKEDDLHKANEYFKDITGGCDLYDFDTSVMETRSASMQRRSVQEFNIQSLLAEARRMRNAGNGNEEVEHEGNFDHLPCNSETGEDNLDHLPCSSENGDGNFDHFPCSSETGEDNLDHLPCSSENGDGNFDHFPCSSETGEDNLDHLPCSSETGEDNLDHLPDSSESGEGNLDHPPCSSESGEDSVGGGSVGEGSGVGEGSVDESSNVGEGSEGEGSSAAEGSVGEGSSEDDGSRCILMLPGMLAYTMIDAVPSQSGKQLILAGNRDNLGTLAQIYDINTSGWTPAPNLPGYNNGMTGYKRGNVGAALDPVTGLVYIYGGFPIKRFSNEISVLDTSSGEASKMQWTLSLNQTTVPELYEPFVTYLHARKQIFVFGGCDFYNVTSGLVGRCAPLNVGYFFFNGASPTILGSQQVALNAAPPARFHSCQATLKDGRILLQGGRDQTRTFGDAWILDPSTWTWSKQVINGPAQAMTRAGHACEMGPEGQLLVIGGFHKVGDVSTYVMPSIAVIDTNTWTWISQFKGAPVEKIWTSHSFQSPCGDDDDDDDDDDDGNANCGEIVPPATGSAVLSAGAKAGIGFGVVIGLLVVGFLAFWAIRRRKRLQASQLHAANNKEDTYRDKTNGKTGAAFIPMSHTSSMDDNGNKNKFASTMNSSHARLERDNSKSGQIETLKHVDSTSSLAQTSKSAAMSSGPMSTAVTTLPLYASSITESRHSTSDSVVETGDAALAAAMLQAEDKVYHQPGHSSANTSNSNSASTVFSAYRHPHQPLGDGSTKVMYIPGPQSVPENEALIERSSPGVPVHAVHAQFVGQDGLLPALTPGGSYSTSVVVGGSVPYPAYSAQTQTAVSHETLSEPGNSGGYIAHHPGTGSHTLLSGSSFGADVTAANSNNSVLTSAGAGEGGYSPVRGPELPYRDPQMLKDLEDITMMIQREQEPKSPHTIQPSN
ncbi:hypothetical protein BG004_008076 [Podila humilis]|nr:hypothetical protein BG004_008076 [Podila humilis]